MSLDVYLIQEEKVKKTSSGIFIRENGQMVEISAEEWGKRYPDREPVTYAAGEQETNEVYSANITHNLSKMAGQAGIYEALWKPHKLKEGYNISEDDHKAEREFESNTIMKAKELIAPLREGLHKLKMEPEKYKKFNPENGWGSYDGLVKFVENYLNACYKNQEAKVEVSR